MNCSICGILYQDTVSHPPEVCSKHAGEKLKKAQEALDSALTTISRLQAERRGFQIMARGMFGLAKAALWRDQMEEGKYERAGGNVDCVSCRRLYVEHPELPGLPTFHMLCSGKIVKT